jgi:membrane-bound lytic murein transglycosylase B
MTFRGTVVMALAVLAALAGCSAPQSAPASPAVPDGASGARAVPVDPVLVPALDGVEPKAAKDPVALARQLVVAETAVRDRTSRPEVVAAAGRTAQVAYRALLERPGWDTAVLARVPPNLRTPVRDTTVAGRELQSMVTRLPATLPAWRIVDPLPPDQLRAYYLEAQRRFGVPWTVLAAVNLVETGSGRIVGLSLAGAQGPMQFIPGTWARYGLGGNVWNPRDAILGAANYLAANGGGDRTSAGLDRALYRYNNDARYVRAVRHYADVMGADERAFLGLHARQIYYRTQIGDVLLPTGYESKRPIPVQEWLARRPR